MAMAESFGEDFTVVLVTADSLDPRMTQLWVAAAKPNQAITLVLSEVPEGWTASAVERSLSRKLLDHFRDLRLEPGEVRKLNK